MTTMYDNRVRTAVRQYLNGSLTEAEAARRAGLSRAQLREYARTSGVLFPAVDPLEPVDETPGDRRKADDDEDSEQAEMRR